MPRNPQRPSRTQLAHWMLGLGCGLAAALLMRLTASEAPFGAALPPLATAVSYAGIKGKDTDFLAGRVPEPYLEFLAAQPDGTPPLRHVYSNEHAGFRIKHPTGVELTQLDARLPGSGELDAAGEFHFNQPLRRVKYILPKRVNGETATEFMARNRHEMLQLGWEPLLSDERELEVKGYLFQRLEFMVLDPATDEASGARTPSEFRVWYVGPLGDRLLLIEFSGRPEHADLARNQADKIIRSFVPSPALLEVLTGGHAAASPEPKAGETDS